MEMTGDILIAADRKKVWQALNSEAILMHCIPGCESIESTSPTEKLARVLVKVGPVRARFVGKIRMDDVKPNVGCVLHFEGSSGAAGMATGKSVVELRDEGQHTRLTYTAQASVGGKLGQIGGRMMDAASKQMADQFFAALNNQLSQGQEIKEDVNPFSKTDSTVFDNNSSVINKSPLHQNSSSSESVRVLWFLLGVASTSVGVLLASAFK